MALNPLNWWGEGGGVSVALKYSFRMCVEGSSTVGSQDSIFLFLEPLSNQPSGCNDGLLMALQSIEGALCC